MLLPEQLADRLEAAPSAASFARAFVASLAEVRPRGSGHRLELLQALRRALATEARLAPLKNALLKAPVLTPGQNVLRLCLALGSLLWAGSSVAGGIAEALFDVEWKPAADIATEAVPVAPPPGLNGSSTTTRLDGDGDGGGDGVTAADDGEDVARLLRLLPESAHDDPTLLALLRSGAVRNRLLGSTASETACAEVADLFSRIQASRPWRAAALPHLVEALARSSTNPFTPECEETTVLACFLSHPSARWALLADGRAVAALRQLLRLLSRIFATGHAAERGELPDHDAAPVRRFVYHYSIEGKLLTGPDKVDTDDGADDVYAAPDGKGMVPPPLPHERRARSLKRVETKRNVINLQNFVLSLCTNRGKNRGVLTILMRDTPAVTTLLRLLTDIACHGWSTESRLCAIEAVGNILVHDVPSNAGARDASHGSARRAVLTDWGSSRRTAKPVKPIGAAVGGSATVEAARTPPHKRGLTSLTRSKGPPRPELSGTADDFAGAIVEYVVAAESQRARRAAAGDGGAAIDIAEPAWAVLQRMLRCDVVGVAAAAARRLHTLASDRNVARRAALLRFLAVQEARATAVGVDESRESEAAAGDTQRVVSSVPRMLQPFARSITSCASEVGRLQKRMSAISDELGRGLAGWAAKHARATTPAAVLESVQQRVSDLPLKSLNALETLAGTPSPGERTVINAVNALLRLVHPTGQRHTVAQVRAIGAADLDLGDSVTEDRGVVDDEAAVTVLDELSKLLTRVRSEPVAQPLQLMFERPPTVALVRWLTSFTASVLPTINHVVVSRGAGGVGSTADVASAAAEAAHDAELSIAWQRRRAELETQRTLCEARLLVARVQAQHAAHEAETFRSLVSRCSGFPLCGGSGVGSRSSGCVACDCDSRASVADSTSVGGDQTEPGRYEQRRSLRCALDAPSSFLYDDDGPLCHVRGEDVAPFVATPTTADAGHASPAATTRVFRVVAVTLDSMAILVPVDGAAQLAVPFDESNRDLPIFVASIEALAIAVPPVADDDVRFQHQLSATFDCLGLDAADGASQYQQASVETHEGTGEDTERAPVAAHIEWRVSTPMEEVLASLVSLSPSQFPGTREREQFRAVVLPEVVRTIAAIAQHGPRHCGGLLRAHVLFVLLDLIVRVGLPISFSRDATGGGVGDPCSGLLDIRCGGEILDHVSLASWLIGEVVVLSCRLRPGVSAVPQSVAQAGLPSIVSGHVFPGDKQSDEDVVLASNMEAFLNRSKNAWLPVLARFLSAALPVLPHGASLAELPAMEESSPAADGGTRDAKPNGAALDDGENTTAAKDGTAGRRGAGAPGGHVAVEGYDSVRLNSLLLSSLGCMSALAMSEGGARVVDRFVGIDLVLRVAEHARAAAAVAPAIVEEHPDVANTPTGKLVAADNLTTSHEARSRGLAPLETKPGVKAPRRSTLRKLGAPPTVLRSTTKRDADAPVQSAGVRIQGSGIRPVFANVPPRYVLLGLAESAMLTLQRLLFWKPCHMPALRTMRRLQSLTMPEFSADRTAAAEAMGDVDPDDVAGRLEVAHAGPHGRALQAAERRLAMTRLACIRNFLVGGGAGQMPPDDRIAVAHDLAKRLLTLPLPSVGELERLVGALQATRLTADTMPPLMSLLTPSVSMEFDPRLRESSRESVRRASVASVASAASDTSARSSADTTTEAGTWWISSNALLPLPAPPPQFSDVELNPEAVSTLPPLKTVDAATLKAHGNSLAKQKELEVPQPEPTASNDVASARTDESNEVIAPPPPPSREVVLYKSVRSRVGGGFAVTRKRIVKVQAMPRTSRPSTPPRHPSGSRAGSSTRSRSHSGRRDIAAPPTRSTSSPVTSPLRVKSPLPPVVGAGASPGTVDRTPGTPPTATSSNSTDLGRTSSSPALSAVSDSPTRAGKRLVSARSSPALAPIRRPVALPLRPTLGTPPPHDLTAARLRPGSASPPSPSPMSTRRRSSSSSGGGGGDGAAEPRSEVTEPNVSDSGGGKNLPLVRRDGMKRSLTVTLGHLLLRQWSPEQLEEDDAGAQARMQRVLDAVVADLPDAWHIDEHAGEWEVVTPVFEISPEYAAEEGDEAAEKILAMRNGAGSNARSGSFRPLLSAMALRPSFAHVQASVLRDLIRKFTLSPTWLLTVFDGSFTAAVYAHAKAFGALVRGARQGLLLRAEEAQRIVEPGECSSLVTRIGAFAFLRGVLQLQQPSVSRQRHASARTSMAAVVTSAAGGCLCFALRAALTSVSRRCVGLLRPGDVRKLTRMLVSGVQRGGLEFLVGLQAMSLLLEVAASSEAAARNARRDARERSEKITSDSVRSARAMAAKSAGLRRPIGTAPDAPQPLSFRDICSGMSLRRLLAMLRPAGSALADMLRQHSEELGRAPVQAAADGEMPFERVRLGPEERRQASELLCAILRNESERARRRSSVHAEAMAMAAAAAVEEAAAAGAAVAMP